MAVAFDAVGPSSSGVSFSAHTSPVTWTHTGVGSNLAVIAIICFDEATSATVPACTYNGVAMTLIGANPANNANNGYLYFFGIANAPTGAQTISFSWTGGPTTPDIISAGSISWTGAALTFAAAFGPFQPNPLSLGQGSAANPSLSVKSTMTTSSVVCAIASGASTITSQSGGSQKFLANNGSSGDCGSIVASTAVGTGGQISFTSSITSASFAIDGVEVLPPSTTVAGGQAKFPPSFKARYRHGRFGPRPRQPAINPSWPKLQTLIDNFVINDLATNWAETIGTVTWSQGQVAIKADTSYDSALVTYNLYDFTNSYLYLFVTPYVNTSAQTSIQIVGGNPATSTNNLYFGFSGSNNLVLYKTINGTQTQVNSVTYNASTMAWWRIRESGGTVFLDTAPDGVTWTNQFSTPDTTFSFPLNAVSVYMLAGDFGSDPVGTTYIYRVNTNTGAAFTSTISGGIAVISSTKNLIGRILAAILVVTAGIKNSIRRTLTAAATVTGTMARFISRTLSAILTISSIAKVGFSFFNQILPAGTSSSVFSSGTTDLGIQFNVTSSGYVLDGFWMYVPTGGDTTGSNYTFALYSTTNGITGTQVGSTLTGSGTYVAGAWNFAGLGTPLGLVNGDTYTAVYHLIANDPYQFVANYWSSGAGSAGITNGPITAPSSSSALNNVQDGYNQPGGGSIAFPTSVFNSSWYGIDVEVIGGTSTIQHLLTVAAQLVLTGNVPRRVNRAVQATTTVTGSVSRSISRTLAAILVLTGSLVRRVSRTVTTNVVVTTVVLRMKTAILVATLTVTVSVQRMIGRILAAIALVTGTLARSVRHTLNVVTIAAVSLTRSLTRTLAGTIIVTGSISYAQRLLRTIAATITVFIPSASPPVLVQHGSGTGSTPAANTATITLPQPTGSGNTLIVAVSYVTNSAESTDLTSVTLGGSGTGFSSQAKTNGANYPFYNISYWANYNIAGGQTSLVVSVAGAANGFDVSVDAYEVDDLLAVDQSVFNEVESTNTNWTSNATGTLSHATEFAVGLIAAYDNTGSSFTITGPSSPWTNEAQLTVNTQYSQMSGYQITGSTGALTYAGTANVTGGNLSYIGGVATFTAVPGISGFVRQVNFHLAGVATAVGSIARRAGRLLSPVVAVTSTVTRSVSRSITATIVVTATLARTIMRSLSAVVALTATTAMQKFKTVVLSAAIAVTSSVSRQVSRPLTAMVALNASVQRYILRTLVATLITYGIVYRSIDRAFSTILAVTSSVAKQTGKPLNSAVTLTGVILRSLGKPITPVITVIASTSRFLTRTLNAVVTLPATLSAVKAKFITLAANVVTVMVTSRSIGRTLSGLAVATSSTVRSCGRIINGVITSTGSLTRSITRTVSATVVVTASTALLKAKNIILIATAVTYAAMPRSVQKTIAASATLTTNTLRSCGKGVLAGLITVPNLTRQVSRNVTTTVVLVSSLSISKVRNIALTCTVAITGATTRRVLPIISAATTIASSTTRVISRSIQGNLSVAGQTVRQMGRGCTAGLVATSQVTRQIGRTLTSPIAVTLVIKRIYGYIITTGISVSPSVKVTIGKVLTAVVTFISSVGGVGHQYLVTLTTGITTSASTLIQIISGAGDFVFRKGTMYFRWVIGSVGGRWKT